MKRERKEYIARCEISELCEAELGGFRQKFLIEGLREGTPVVVFLHGGPGFPVPFCTGARGLFPDVTRFFTAVYWDQLGCGINNRKVDDSFTIQSFVNMTADLVRYLKRRFPREKLYLFGISWGSVLALETAILLPELVSGVFAAGQVLLPPLLSAEFFEAVEGSSAPRRVKAKMRGIRTAKELSTEQMTAVSKAARKYTEAYGGKGGRGVKNPVKEIFSGKDYRFRDAIACFVNGYRKNTSLIRELGTIDLREKFARITVPYTVFGGKSDLVTPVRDVEACFAALGKEGLTCKSFEGEGHIPSQAVMEEIFAEIKRAAEA